MKREPWHTPHRRGDVTACDHEVHARSERVVTVRFHVQHPKTRSAWWLDADFDEVSLRGMIEVAGKALAALAARRRRDSACSRQYLTDALRDLDAEVKP